MFLAFLSHLFTAKAQKNEFSKYPVYKGTDLGCIYKPTATQFKIWAPTASDAELIFYADGENGKETNRVSMLKKQTVYGLYY